MKKTAHNMWGFEGSLGAKEKTEIVVGVLIAK
jgi:hypothetical protein